MNFRWVKNTFEHSKPFLGQFGSGRVSSLGRYDDTLLSIYNLLSYVQCQGHYSLIDTDKILNELCMGGRHLWAFKTVSGAIWKW